MVNPSHACKDSEIGGGVQGRRPENCLGNLYFIYLLMFLVLSVFYNLQKVSNGFITGKSILFQGSRGGPTLSWWEGVQLFQGGGRLSNSFQGGIHLLICIETHITCDFQMNVSH